jgi:hypothetical protein
VRGRGGSASSASRSPRVLGEQEESIPRSRARRLIFSPLSSGVGDLNRGV